MNSFRQHLIDTTRFINPTRETNSFRQHLMTCLEELPYVHKLAESSQCNFYTETQRRQWSQCRDYIISCFLPMYAWDESQPAMMRRDGGSPDGLSHLSPSKRASLVCLLRAVVHIDQPIQTLFTRFKFQTSVKRSQWMKACAQNSFKQKTTNSKIFRQNFQVPKSALHTKHTLFSICSKCNMVWYLKIGDCTVIT